MVDKERIDAEVGAVALDAGLENILRGIELCASNKLMLSTLVLLYGGMDTLTSLDRPSDQPYVQREDFLAWVGTYLLPDSGLTTTPLELYAARCSLLHTFGPRSKLVVKGKARSLSYAWGTANPAELQREIDDQGRKDLIAVHIDQLVVGFRAAAERWKQAVLADGDKASRTMERTSELYFPMDAEFFRKYRAAKAPKTSGGA
jgi:hypothetical protein